jgi:hypothetical protein
MNTNLNYHTTTSTTHLSYYSKTPLRLCVWIWIHTDIHRIHTDNHTNIHHVRRGVICSQGVTFFCRCFWRETTVFKNFQINRNTDVYVQTQSFTWNTDVFFSLLRAFWDLVEGKMRRFAQNASFKHAWIQHVCSYYLVTIRLDSPL